MLKVIVIGDQHFKVDNIEEVDLFISKVEEIIFNIKPDFVVLLGDLLEPFKDFDLFFCCKNC